MSLSTVFQRLKERKLVQWALAYLAGAWAVFEVTDAVGGRWNLPDVLLQGLSVVIGIGFFMTLVLAWYHGEKGRQRVSGPELLMMAALLVIAGGVLALLGSRQNVSRAVPETVVSAVEDDGRPSIAVLPLDDFSPSPDDDYFADGVHEEIISKLSKIAALRVIDRNSVMGYRDVKKPTRQVAGELGVGFILEGSARIGGGMVRLTLQLIDGRTAERIWSENYDRRYSVENFILIQGEIAQEVASRIRVDISPGEKAQIAEIPTRDLNAYEYYLRGNRYFSRSLANGDFWAALQMYDRAVDLDSTFALALARRSSVKSRLHFYGLDRAAPLLKQAEQDLARAAALDPELPEVHLARGYLHYWGLSEYGKAMEEFSIVTRSEPGNAEVWGAIGFIQRRQGKFEDALLNLGKAAALDPLTARWPHHMGIACLWLRRYSTATQYYDRAISLSPEVSSWYQGNGEGKAEALLLWDGNTTRARSVVQDAQLGTELRASPFNYVAFVMDVMDRRYQDAMTRLRAAPAELAVFEQQVFAPTDLLKGQVLSLMGQIGEAGRYFEVAVQVLKGLIEENPDEYRFHSSLGLAYAGLGDKTRAVAEAQRGVDLLPIRRDAYQGTFPLLDLARVNTLVGEYEPAIDGLEFLLSVPSNLSVPMLRLDPIWDPLRDNPRFQALLKKYAEPAGRPR